MAASVYDDLADAIRELVQGEARVVSPPVERWKVTQAEPLVIESTEDDIVLEEGDPDVEIDRLVLALRPEVGDTVRVHQDGSDWIIAGVIA